MNESTGSQQDNDIFGFFLGSTTKFFKEMLILIAATMVHNHYLDLRHLY